MRLLPGYSAVALLGCGFSVAAQAQAAADQWFLKHDLFSIPVTRQAEARPGTLIALLPTGEIAWLHPADVIDTKPMFFTVFSDESKEAVQVGVIAKFLSVGLAGQLKNSSTLTIQQADFQGTGYEDGPREKNILMKGTTVTNMFEEIQDDYDKQNRQVPIYFVQKVFTTADLQITNGRNIAGGGSANATTPGSCTDVSVGTGGGNGTGTGSSANTETGSGTGTGTLPGAGALFCYGKGDKDTLKANHQVPVAMSVCNVYYYKADNSWNCRPALKSIHFK